MGAPISAESASRSPGRSRGGSSTKKRWGPPVSSTPRARSASRNSATRDLSIKRVADGPILDALQLALSGQPARGEHEEIVGRGGKAMLRGARVQVGERRDPLALSHGSGERRRDVVGIASGEPRERGRCDEHPRSCHDRLREDRGASLVRRPSPSRCWLATASRPSSSRVCAALSWASKRAWPASRAPHTRYSRTVHGRERRIERSEADRSRSELRATGDVEPLDRQETTANVGAARDGGDERWPSPSSATRVAARFERRALDHARRHRCRRGGRARESSGGSLMARREERIPAEPATRSRRRP